MAMFMHDGKHYHVRFQCIMNLFYWMCNIKLKFYLFYVVVGVVEVMSAGITCYVK